MAREFNREADALAKAKLQEFLAIRNETNDATEILPQIMDAYNVVMEDEL